MPASVAPTKEPTADVSRVAFVSLGCPKNLVDSEQMLGTLRDSGLQLVNESDDADAIIINTCGFLEASKEESLSVIRDAIERKNRGEVKRVVVAGCLVQRHRAKMLDWAPGIDSMIGVFDRDHVLEAVRPGAPSERGIEGEGSSERFDVSPSPLTPPFEGEGDSPRYWITSNALVAAKDRGRNTVGLTVNGADGKGVGYFEDDSRRFRLTPRHWAYLRVSEGCNQKCAFCTIPSIRGKMRSKPLDRIVSEARTLLADGAFELNLIGQDTTSYGYDIYGRRRGAKEASNEGAIGIGSNEYSGDLIGLLHALNDVGSEFGRAWMRLMYVYPTYFTDEMIDTIASLPNIVNYIDIPLQHMSDRMLAAMRRNIVGSQQKDLLYKLRERIPGLAIRTTFITGFPGETDEDHHELLEFIEKFQFDMLGVFKYSREENTPAGTMDLDPALHVSDEVKEAREREIMLLQQDIAFENAKYLAEEKCEFDVLLERPVAKEGEAATKRYLGRAYHQAPQVDSVTYIESSESLSPGELVRCTIVDANGYDLIAQPTEQYETKRRLPVIGSR